MSAPGFLLANGTNYLLLQSLLESMNAIIEHQYQSEHHNMMILKIYQLHSTGNSTFVQAVVKSKKRFEALRSFTLESGKEEIERLKQRRKDHANESESPNSPGLPLRNNSMDSVRSPLNPRTPVLTNVPEEGGVFAIGDDESDDNGDGESRPTPSQSSPSAQYSRTPSEDSAADERLPAQLRGMSEKARGKMPAGQPSFSRQNSTASLNPQSTNVLAPSSSFDPSAQWVSHCPGSGSVSI